MPSPSPDDRTLAALESAAEELLRAGRASPEVEQSLNQLQADRTNGESLTPARERLRRALHGD